MSSSAVRVLITGGAGFIGSHLADTLLEEGYRVGIFDSLDPQVHGHSNDQWPSWTRRQKLEHRKVGDVRDSVALLDTLETFRPHVIVHLAAQVGVGQGETQFERYVDQNVRGTAVLLEQILAANDSVEKDEDGIRRLIVAGSMSSYGEGMWVCATHGPTRAQRSPARVSDAKWGVCCPFANPQFAKLNGGEICPTPEELKPLPIEEVYSLRPSSIYAITKRDQEDLALQFGAARGISVAVTRFFNVMGSRQSLSNPYTGVGAIFASRALAGLAPRVYEDGHQVRDFIHVSDVADAVMRLCGSWQLRAAVRQWSSPIFQGVFNVSTGRPTSILELATEVSKRLGGPAPEVTGQFRTGDIRGCIGSSKRLREATGWQPKVSLAQAIDELCSNAKGAISLEHAQQDHDKAHRELEEAGLLLQTQGEEPGTLEPKPEEEQPGSWVG